MKTVSRLHCLPSLGVALLTLAACGGNEPREQSAAASAEPAGNFFVGQHPVYGHLRTGSAGSWVFTTITDSDVAPDSGFLVRLNDLTPAFDTRVAECMPQVYPDSHRCSVSNPFREKDAGVIDKLISGGIAVGTAGKVTDISANYETTFDEPAFNQAVDEALINTGLNATRKQVIANVERYDVLLAEGRMKLAGLEGQAATARDSVNDAFRVDVRPQVSGLTGFYGGDIDFRELVRLTPKNGGAAHKAQLPDAAPLPCDVRECLGKTANAIAELEMDIARNEAIFASSIQPQTMMFDVDCSDTRAGAYTVRVQCPAEIELTRNTAAPLPLQATILSRDFGSVYPAFDLADDRLRLEIDGQEIRFTNPTSNYLTVTAQTVYYNAQVETSAERIELAPGVSITRDISEFVSPSIDIEATYPQMTPGKAAGSSFRFGFAARYRVANNPDEQTLYATNTFNVGCVIENRLRPGSCATNPDSRADEDERKRRLPAEEVGPPTQG